MFLHIQNVEYIKDYILRLEFNDGTVKEVDLRYELFGEMFESLKDINLFKQVKISRNTNTIEWPNGADFAPEFLYQIGKEVRMVA